MDTLIWMFVGGGIGFLLAQLSLLFFMDEIFDFIDNLVERVRKFFNLPT